MEPNDDRAAKMQAVRERSALERAQREAADIKRRQEVFGEAAEEAVALLEKINAKQEQNILETNESFDVLAKMQAKVVLDSGALSKLNGPVHCTVQQVGLVLIARASTMTL